MPDLSIIIPARNEMFLQNTINDILKNGQIQDRLRLSFQLTSDEPSQGQYDDFTCD